MKIRHGWLGAILGLAFWSLAGSAQGAIVTGLYEASVPVADQSAQARSVALQQALAAVLVKVTGERTVGSVPALAALMQDPNRFLQQYHYEQTQDQNGNSQTGGVTYFDLTRNGPLAIAGTGLVLHAKFDPDAVNQAVQSAGEPVWGSERPATLVWLALQDGATRSILSASGNPAVVQAMNGVATQRGIPLIFPNMDAQDQQAIAFTDVWTDNQTVIQQASARYHPDAILIGDIYSMNAGQYAVRWQLMSGDSVQAWNGITGDLPTIAADGLQTAADSYAKQYSIAAGSVGVNDVPVEVQGVDNVDAYAKVLAYLNSLTPVKSVQVRHVTASTVTFRIDARGSEANLAAAITLGDLLKPVAQFAAPTTTMAAPGAVTGMSPSAATIAPPAAAGVATLQFKYTQ